MKTLLIPGRGPFMAVALILAAAANTAESSAPPFHDALAPHGTWMFWEGGVNVWQPAVVANRPEWRPYYHEGRWIWTGSAWKWQSDYPWGAIVFHYGRWWPAPGVGWVWVPGSVYAPAWVHWRYVGNTWGWAPMPPPSSFHMQLYHGYRWSTGYSHGVTFTLSPSHYVFVPAASFGAVCVSSVGFSGSSGIVRFDMTRTVTSGPSPYTVGAAGAMRSMAGTGIGVQGTTDMHSRRTAAAAAFSSPSLSHPAPATAPAYARTAPSTASPAAPLASSRRMIAAGVNSPWSSQPARSPRESFASMPASPLGSHPAPSTAPTGRHPAPATAPAHVRNVPFVARPSGNVPLRRLNAARGAVLLPSQARAAQRSPVRGPAPGPEVSPSRQEQSAVPAPSGGSRRSSAAAAAVSLRR